jgi:hypothetical protein
MVASRFELPIPNQIFARYMRRWWHGLLTPRIEDKEKQLQAIIYTTWNIWKDRCRRVFQNKAIAPDQLTVLIREDIRAPEEANKAVEK